MFGREVGFYLLSGGKKEGEGVNVLGKGIFNW